MSVGGRDRDRVNVLLYHSHQHKLNYKIRYAFCRYGERFCVVFSIYTRHFFNVNLLDKYSARLIIFASTYFLYIVDCNHLWLIVCYLLCFFLVQSDSFSFRKHILSFFKKKSYFKSVCQQINETSRNLPRLQMYSRLLFTSSDLNSN